MALTILNNIASIAAENQLTITSNNLQSTLFQLSSGSRINSGADDAAGLAIANGLGANISALTQSARNANDGVGSLQVADGALAQVTTLLNRAVTLATESATGTVSNSQRGALDAEYQAIQAEINRIGSNTNYNGGQVFTASPTSIYISDGVGNTQQASNFISVTTGQLSAAGVLGSQASAQLAFQGVPTALDTVTVAGKTYTFVAALTQATANQVLIDTTGATTADKLTNTIANFVAAVNGANGSGTVYSNATTANANTTASAYGDSVHFQATAAGNAIIAGGGTLASTEAGTNTAFLNGATFAGGSTSDLTTATNAQAALAAINTAIQSIAGIRGQIGASINRLQSAGTVISNQVQNLTAAQNGITAADIPSAVAALTKYSILEQTGISSLAQANQQQQLVLKLLQ